MTFENPLDRFFFSISEVFIFIFGLLTGIQWIILDFTDPKMLISFCVCIQLVQVIINTTHLEQSCHYLEEFISNITNVPPHTANATKLYGTSTFKVLLTTCFSQRNTIIYICIYVYICMYTCVCIFHCSTHVICPFAGCSSCSWGRDLHQPECQNWSVSTARRLRLVGFSTRGQRRSQRLPDWPDSFSEEHLQCFHQSTCKSTGLSLTPQVYLSPF